MKSLASRLDRLADLQRSKHAGDGVARKRAAAARILATIFPGIDGADMLVRACELAPRLRAGAVTPQERQRLALAPAADLAACGCADAGGFLMLLEHLAASV